MGNDQRWIGRTSAGCSANADAQWGAANAAERAGSCANRSACRFVTIFHNFDVAEFNEYDASNRIGKRFSSRRNGFAR